MKPAAIVAALAVAALVIGWGVWQERPSGVPADAGTAGAGPTMWERADAAAAAADRAPAPSAAAASAAASAAATQPLPPGMVDVCGLGLMPESALPTSAWGGIGLTPADRDALAKTMAALEAGAPLERAVARMVRGVAEVEAEAPLESRICDSGDLACERTQLANWQRHQELTARLGERLARDALASRDPTQLAIAQNVCHAFSSLGGEACDRELIAAWTAVDADNAMAWLAAYQVAFQRGDRQAADEAMYRASQARIVDNRMGPALQLLQRPTFAPEGGVASLYAARAVVQLAETSGAQAHVGAYCSAKLLGDANRRLLCARLARVLLDGDKTQWGQNIAERVRAQAESPGHEAPPAEITLARRAAIDAMPQRQRLASLSCDGMRRVQAQALRIADIGELAQVDEWIAESGRSVAQWAQIERDRRTAMARRLAAERVAEPASQAAQSGGR